MSTTSTTVSSDDARLLRFAYRFWAGYLLLVGALLLLFPNDLIGLFGIDDIQDNWIRVLGALIFNLGLVYFPIIRDLHKGFIHWSIYSRFVFFGFTIVIVLAGWLPANLLIFGAWDALNALFTWYAYRKANL